MGGKHLTGEQQRFIVICLARGLGGALTAKAVYRQFKVTVSLQALNHYDPTTVMGGKLTDDLKQLFVDTRKKHLESVKEMATAHQENRLSRWEELFEMAVARGDLKLADKILNSIQGAMEDRKGVDINTSGEFVVRVIGGLDSEPVPEGPAITENQLAQEILNDASKAADLGADPNHL